MTNFITLELFRGKKIYKEALGRAMFFAMGY